MKDTFLLEIGLEEIPAHLVTSSANQLLKRSIDFFKEKRLAYDDIKVYSTPRRLAIKVLGLSEKTDSIDETFRGPSIKIAKDENGDWSKAAIGFVNGKGGNVADLIEKDGYVYYEKHTDGINAKDVLADIVTDVVSQMKFSTYMKWANFDFEYVRPIRWLITMLNQEVIKTKILDVESGNITRGHRFLSTSDVVIDDANNYEDILEKSFVIADAKKRKEFITNQIEEIANNNGWILNKDAGLLEEVNNIVEWPTAFTGSFDEKYLELPDCVLYTSMREHQRFFSVRDNNGEFLPHFISVRNGNDDYMQNVVSGNEKVLVARLEDAKFFYEEDQKHSIDEYMQKVKKLVFHEKIGSVFEHMERTALLTHVLGEKLNLSAEEMSDLSRASEIYKFDLMTGMVGEFDELQGDMGQIYANIFGENSDVSTAIKEHYMPISSEGELPKTQLGAILSLADKLESILSFFAVGLIPSGSNDPYALRRSALGIVRIILNKKWNISIKEIIESYTQLLSAESFGLSSEIISEMKINSRQVEDFILDRLVQIADVRKDIALAAIDNNSDLNIYELDRKILLLANHVNDNDFKQVAESLSRIQNIADKNDIDTKLEIDSKLFETDSEKVLYDVYLEAEKITDLEDLYKYLANNIKTINSYFENTMIMVDSEEIKSNRLLQMQKFNNVILRLGKINSIVIK